MGGAQAGFSSDFGQFVRDNHAPRTGEMPEIPYPLSQESRAVIAHHLIPLALVARADGEESAVELRAILDHAMAMLAKAGFRLSDVDRSKLSDYIAGFRPSLMQLDLALHRLEGEDTDTKIAFLGAVRAVVMADGRLDPQEARRLDRLKLEFARA